MSEYWRSTPKYWCKHCKTFVRDTKLERQNHDATAKHQGNLKRFIRDLHREHDKDAKDKEGAKLEVSRLNRIVSGSSVGESSSSRTQQFPRPTVQKLQPTPPFQRKQQLAQLAEMGVSIPEEFRGEMAMAGEWQVTSERIIMPSDAERGPEALGVGVRKRAVNDEEEQGTEPKRGRWGSGLMAYPQEDEDDLDALLGKPIAIGKAASGNRDIKDSTDEGDEDTQATMRAKSDGPEMSYIKEESGDESKLTVGAGNATDIGIKQNVVFKKRAKAKNIRQK